MSKGLSILITFFIISVGIINSGCTKEDEKPEVIITPLKPTIKVSDAVDITDTSAKISIAVESHGWIIRSKALCLYINHPEINASGYVLVGDLNPVQVYELCGLFPDKEYFYDAYVMTDMYVSFSEVKSFKTKKKISEL